MRNREDLKNEHELVRNHVGFYDFTHETLEVTGKDAREFLDYIYVNDVAKLKPGTGLYTTMLNEDGKILDDVIVFCRDTEEFWITGLFIEQLKKWLNEHLGDRVVNFKDITAEMALYAIQGPKSKDVINAVVADNIDDLENFDIKNTTVDGIDVMVAKAGFTGSLGYELHFHPKFSAKIEEILADKGKPFSIGQVTQADVMLHTLPAEAGFVLSDDFTGTNPFELGLGWTVKFDKDFIGKEKTSIYLTEEPKRNLIGFAVDADNANVEQNDIVKLAGEEVGKVTKSTYGYTVDKYIGFALVDSKAKVGDKVTIATNAGEVEATLQKRKIYTSETASTVTK